MPEPSLFPLRGPCGHAVLVRRVSSDRGRRTRHSRTGGFPGTWEILPSPPDHSALGCAEPKAPRPIALASWAVGAKPRRTAVVPPSEGNEVRRDGPQEVVAP